MANTTKAPPRPPVPGSIKDPSSRLHHLNTSLDTITITLEEYKELLMIKGKYEELKSLYCPALTYPKTTIYRDLKEDNTKELKPPYKVTC